MIEYTRGCATPITGPSSGWVPSFFGFEQALNLQPFAEALNPAIHGQAAFGHAESMTALRIYVQFGATPGGLPFQIKFGAADGSDLIVTGDGNEHGGRVRRDGLSVRAAAINRRGKVGAARCVIFHDYAHGEHTACREAHQAYAVEGNAPFRCPLTNKSDSLRAIGDGELDGLLPRGIRCSRRRRCG